MTGGVVEQILKREADAVESLIWSSSSKVNLEKRLGCFYRGSVLVFFMLCLLSFIRSSVFCNFLASLFLVNPRSIALITPGPLLDSKVLVWQELTILVALEE